MRIAVVSDIHGNKTAFEAVLADLRQASPDLIMHGGDLADAGSSPVEIVDRIRDLGWPGVMGNTDEMLARPESLTEFAKQTPQMQPLLPVIEEMAAATRDALGEERLSWLGQLPRAQVHGSLALVHASPESPWRAPQPEASDAELESVYELLGRPVAAYGHIHRSHIRVLPGSLSSTPAVSVCRTTATAARPTFCWTTRNRKSAAWSMTSNSNCRLCPKPTFLTPTGLRRSSRVLVHRCRNRL